MDFSNGFRTPDRRYSPVPFWFLNEKLDAHRLQWQVGQMHAQHVYGAVMHARPGLVTPYLSEEWFQAIGAILEKSRELGMFMWIYDEYPWMSGMAEYRVPKLHPDFRIRALDRLEKKITGPVSLEWSFGGDLPDDCAGVVTAVLYGFFNGRITGPGQELSLCADGKSLQIEIPEGNYLACVFYERLSWNPYGDGFGRHPVSDLMHPEAMQAFLDLTHREYEKRFGEYLGTTITASFNDEPPSDTPGWSRVLLDEFQQRKGYSLKPWLGMLWHDCEQAPQARLDWSDVVGQLYEENFFGAIYDWCERTGIASSGHLLLEETLVFHSRFMQDYFRSMRRMHYPGIDYIFPGVIPAVVCKTAASVANLYGRERVMSECFALTGWNFSLQHMKWMTDWQLVHGVNLLVPHAFFYSISEKEPIPEIPDDLGYRWYDCPPSMFYQQPYWDYYHFYSDYQTRTAWMLTRGELAVEIALYYPIESVQAEFIPTKEACNAHAFEIPGTWMTADYLWDGKSVEVTDAHFRASANGLRDAGLDFDVVDDDSLRDCEIMDSKLVVRGKRHYRVLILPRTRWIDPAVYRSVEKLWDTGGQIVATGCLPSRATTGRQDDPEIERITRKIFGISAHQPDAGQQDSKGNGSAFIFSRPCTDMFTEIRAFGIGDFQASSPGIYCQHRKVVSDDVYYLVHHRSETEEQVEIKLKGSGAVTLLDPETGGCKPIPARQYGGFTILNMDFHPYQSVFVVLGSRVEGLNEYQPIPVKLKETKAVTGSWKATLDFGDKSPERTRDLPDFPTLEDLPHSLEIGELAPWESLGLHEFSGGLIYETEFNWDGCVENAWLDLGEVGIAAEVWLNGVSLGVRLWAPYRYRAGCNLKKGENKMRVRVVNTLANSISASYADRRSPTSARDMHVESCARFKPGALRSGLMGPVSMGIE